MPDQIAEMREARLCESFVDRKISRTEFGLEFKRVNVELGSWHQAKSHCRDEDEVGSRPPGKGRAEPGGILYEPSTVSRDVELLSEGPVEKALEVRHQLGF